VTAKPLEHQSSKNRSIEMVNQKPFECVENELAILGAAFRNRFEIRKLTNQKTVSQKHAKTGHKKFKK
jgi:hypothetical protein